MIEFYAHALALDQLQQELSSAAFTGAQLVNARNSTLTDLALAPDHALVGAFIDHIFAQAVSDGTEITLLSRAADLWERGVALCNELGVIRGDLENSLSAPSDPGSADKFNNAAMNAQRLARSVLAIQGEVFALRDDIAPLPHLPEHPRQLDQPASSWDWGNRLLGRRTDALVRSLARLATDPGTRAFAFGGLVSYAGNASASSYLGHVVGGPRRAHRYRDRIARNSVGGWLAANHAPSLTPGQMAAKVRFGPPALPKLPPTLETLLRDAVAATFDLSRTPPPPDFQLGYRRLVTQLELLDKFTHPAVPAVPSGAWTAALFGDPTNPPPSLRPENVDVSGDPGGGVSVGTNSPGSNQPGSDDKGNAAKGCGIVVIALILLDLVQAFVQCVGQWADGHKCTFWDNMLLSKLFQKDPPDPRDPPPTQDPGMTSSGLTAFASTEQAMQMVGMWYDLHVQVWEALDKAYAFLAVAGLIYPGDLISLPLYSQFTSIPASGSWPHRPVNDPLNNYHLYPTSPVEDPAENPSVFPVGANPNAYLVGSKVTADSIAISLWQQIALDETDSVNLDMDADRRYDHECWETRGSIDADPVDVVVLSYGQQ